MRIKSAALAAALLAALALAGCNESNDNALQGWVEADFVFVSPDEQGRVEQLKVREGDHVDKDQLLFRTVGAGRLLAIPSTWKPRLGPTPSAIPR